MLTFECRGKNCPSPCLLKVDDPVAKDSPPFDCPWSLPEVKWKFVKEDWE